MAVYTFNFPDDFGPEFEKDYTVSGSQFSIQVQYMGVLPKQFAGAVAAHMWAFRLIVKGNIVHEGPYYWGIDKRDLSLENVANHLASYWGHDKTVADAQELAGSPEYELDQLVFKCADWMHEYFMQTGEFRDFEIISKYADVTGWDIYLSPNYAPDRIVRFLVADDKKYVAVSCYTRDRELSIKLP